MDNVDGGGFESKCSTMPCDLCCYFSSTNSFSNHTLINWYYCFVKNTWSFNSSHALGFGNKEIILPKVSALAAKRKSCGVYYLSVATQKRWLCSMVLLYLRVVVPSETHVQLAALGGLDGCICSLLFINTPRHCSVHNTAWVKSKRCIVMSCTGSTARRVSQLVLLRCCSTRTRG